QRLHRAALHAWSLISGCDKGWVRSSGPPFSFRPPLDLGSCRPSLGTGDSLEELRSPAVVVPASEAHRLAKCGSLGLNLCSKFTSCMTEERRGGARRSRWPTSQMSFEP